MEGAQTTSAARRPSGRRAGDSGTREAILDAALDLFSERGFEATSVRAVASAAGVDPALVRHFYGDKESLFAASVAARSDIPARLLDALAGDPAARGRRLTDAYLRLWEEDDRASAILITLVRSAATSELAAALFKEILTARTHEPGSRFADEDQRLRALGLASSHLLGIAVARYMIKLPAVASLTVAELVDEIAPTVQRYLDGTHREPPGPSAEWIAEGH